MSAVDREDLDKRIGQVISGKWTLERLIGAGGMAAVYAAKHEIGRKEAIKILHPEVAKDKELVARFKREAHAVNQFSHPGAVEIRDIDTSEDGEPFLVMELLEGESLARRLKKEGVELDEGLRLIDELLDVLVAAHAEGVIHRDIKPSNLFIEPNGKLKVLDFGVARLKHAPGTLITDAGTTLGTIAYMPPEQLRGEEIDRRADIYAAGATLFRIVAGERVHTGGEDEVAAKVLKGPARTLVDVVPDASIGVQKVVDRALAHLVERRYPDARTMQLDVRALIDGEPPPYATTKLQAGDDPRSREPLDDGAEPGEDAKPGDDAELPDGSQPVEDTEPDSEGMTAKKVAKTIVDTGDDADVTTDDDAPTVKRASTKSKKRKKRKSKSEVDLEAPTVVRKKKKRGAKNDKPGKTEIADDDDLAPTRVRKRKPASAVAEEAPRSLSHLEEEKSGKGLIWLVAVILIGVVVVYVMRDRGEETTATKTDPPITKSVAKPSADARPSATTTAPSAEPEPVPSTAPSTDLSAAPSSSTAPEPPPPSTQPPAGPRPKPPPPPVFPSGFPTAWPTAIPSSLPWPPQIPSALRPKPPTPQPPPPPPPSPAPPNDSPYPE